MRIKELRIENNKTQAEIAAILGISRQVFANYEKEINLPDPKMLIKIADLFDVSIDYLVGRSNELDVVKHENNDLTPFETELIKNLRKLDSGNQHKVFGYCYALAN